MRDKRPFLTDNENTPLCEKDGEKLNQCPIWQDKSYIKQDVCPSSRKQPRVTEPSAGRNLRARGHWIWCDDTVTKWQKPLWRWTEPAGWSRADRSIKLVCLPVRLHVNHGLSLSPARRLGETREVNDGMMKAGLNDTRGFNLWLTWPFGARGWSFSLAVFEEWHQARLILWETFNTPTRLERNGAHFITHSHTSVEYSTINHTTWQNKHTWWYATLSRLCTVLWLLVKWKVLGKSTISYIQISVQRSENISVCKSKYANRCMMDFEIYACESNNKKEYILIYSYFDQ